MLTHIQRPVCQRCLNIYYPTAYKKSKRQYSTRLTHYDVLEIDRNANKKDIRSAFVRLSKKHHPDLNHGDPHKHKAFVRLLEAYNTLNERASRHNYDLTLAQAVHQQRVTRDTYSQPAHGASPDPTMGFAPHEARWRYYNAGFKDQISEEEYNARRKKGNALGLRLAFGLITTGFLLHLCAMWYTKNVRLKKLDKQDMERGEHLSRVRLKARELGNEAQLARFKAMHDIKTEEEDT